jgi:monoamine oxidase
VAELIYATDFGASLRDIGMREIMIEKERWRNGEQYLVLNGGFNELFQRAFLDEFESRKSSSSSNSNDSSDSDNDGVVDVRLNWEVKTVEKERYLIKVTGTSFGKRKTLRAKKVVVSLPLPMYRPMLAEKKNISRVTFHPPLSEEKQKALRAVKMGNAVKVLLGFNEKFWPQEDLFNVICDHPAPFPEFWIVSDKEKTITRKEEEDGGGGTNKKNSKKGDVRFVITFFITGDRANAMAKINPKKRIDLAFKQFVGITLQTSDEKEFERIRAKHLKTSETKVWSEERFAGGSYTHPSVGCTRKTREILAKSEWSDTLFFCGEGTNTSVNPCLQGAYETGVRAANEILKVSST